MNNEEERLLNEYEQFMEEVEESYRKGDIGKHILDYFRSILDKTMKRMGGGE
jgi:hypothetical protein